MMIMGTPTATGSGGEQVITHISDFPAAIVEAILSRVPSPIDIASAFKASRLFWGVARSAPFRLRLRPAWYQDGGSIVGGVDDTGLSGRTSYDAQKLASWTRTILRRIRCVMQSTRELDLTGCPVLDDDIAAVLFDLRCLDVLILDGCQKLTSSVAHALVVSVKSGPRVLSLQRCFRLGPAAAGNLLAAAAAGGSRLQVILFSHLDTLELPHEALHLESGGDNKENHLGANVEIVASFKRASPVTGLRILALHNCANLGTFELMAISETCAFLEVLMLGGSMDGLCPSSGDMLSQENLNAVTSTLVGISERLLKLRILEITFFGPPVLQAVREKVSKTIHVWDFCDKDSVASAACVAASLKGLNQFVYGDCKEDFPREVKSIHSESLDYLETRIAVNHLGDLDFKNAEDVLMAIRTGTTCSSLSRRTPLHIAAALGDASVVANLLSIGAAAKGMIDSKGATALFVAAENGHASVCDHLLRKGADVLTSNRAGETPLYIAALRGHSAAVEVMLAHCQEKGLNWQDANLYGDGWTPLMAATLADRQDVGKMLFGALGVITCTTLQDGQAPAESYEISLRHGSEASVSKFGVNGDCPAKSETSKNIARFASEEKDHQVSSLPRPQFLDAQNRYGQTALHIAARQGSLWFITNLLCAGASVDIRDEYRLRAVDIARRKKHSVLEKVLKDWEEQSIGDATHKAPTGKQRSGMKKKHVRNSSTIENLNQLQISSASNDSPDTGSSTEYSDLTLGEDLPSVPDLLPDIMPDVRNSHLATNRRSTSFVRKWDIDIP